MPAYGVLSLRNSGAMEAFDIRILGRSLRTKASGEWSQGSCVERRASSLMAEVSKSALTEWLDCLANRNSP